jgi:dsDNA-specific endonuclease/ATPase MutS2
MRIGDRVRLLRGTEEGRIVNIKGDKIVEVEIEDGFIIPALKNEVVVIDKNEAETFGGNTPVEVPTIQRKEKNPIADGIYLAIVEKQDNKLEMHFINQTDDTVLYSISQNDRKVISGKSYGICEKYDIQEIGNFTSSIFNESKKLNCQLIFHENQTRLKKQPLIVELKINQELLLKKIYLPTIEKDVALVKLEEKHSFEINPSELQEKMMEQSRESPSTKETKRRQPEQTVDLHIDNISIDLKDKDILEFQLNKFEKAYDNALIEDAEKLKVIHGIGAGILRSQIHKRLSVKKEVKYFEDADKERFGFGSTIIYF